MHEGKNIPLPLWLIALDMIGVVLLGLGMAKYFAGVDVVPTALLLDESGLSLMLVGGLLMLPMMWHLIRGMSRGRTVK